MFETPSSQMVQDSKMRLQKAGFNNNQYDDFYKISESYDKLR